MICKLWQMGSVGKLQGIKYFVQVKNHVSWSGVLETVKMEFGKMQAIPHKVLYSLSVIVLT